MKLTHDISNQTDPAADTSAQKNAGIKLSDDELGTVSGGGDSQNNHVRLPAIVVCKYGLSGCGFQKTFPILKLAEHYKKEHSGRCPDCRMGILEVVQLTT